MRIYQLNILFGWMSLVLMTRPIREYKGGQMLGVHMFTEQLSFEASTILSSLHSPQMVISLLLISLKDW